ncbi:MAG TPA: tetratricopeptide repeat protein [Ohtaekwangia sp.]
MKDVGVMFNRTRIVWVMILFSVFFTNAFSQVVPEIGQARYFQLIDQPSKSAPLLKSAIAARPEDATLWYYLGMAQIKNGQKQDAEISFQKGIDLNPKEGINYAGKAHLRFLENNVAEAKKQIEQALTLSKSKNVPVLKAVAEAYLTQKNMFSKDALALLQKAKSIDNKDAEVMLLTGDAYLEQNNGGQAVSSYENAVTLNPKDATGDYKVGLVYLRSKNIEAAEAAFKKATSIDANYTLAYKELGELYYLAKKYPESVAAYEKAMSLTENQEPYKVRYAFFLFSAKNYTKANEVFKALVAKPDASLIAIRYYAQSLYEAGEYQKSSEIFDMYFAKAKPEEIEASDYAYYGRLYNKISEGTKGDTASMDKAIDAFGKALAKDNTILDVRTSHADLLYKRKKFPEAIASFQELQKLRSKPVSQDVYKLGQSYYYSEQFEKADSTFQKLIEMQPNMTVGYLWQARSRASLDPESEKGLAKPSYELVIEKASANPEKGKGDLIEAYSYLGYFLYLQAQSKPSRETLQNSKGYWQKVLDLKPSDPKVIEQANTAIESINEALKG